MNFGCPVLFGNLGTPRVDFVDYYDQVSHTTTTAFARPIPARLRQPILRTDRAPPTSRGVAEFFPKCTTPRSV